MGRECMTRQLTLVVNEEARDVARALGKTAAFEQSRRYLGRLRLRGPCGAQDEFTLAAIAQNLRRLAKLVARTHHQCPLHVLRKYQTLRSQCQPSVAITKISCPAGSPSLQLSFATKSATSRPEQVQQTEQALLDHLVGNGEHRHEPTMSSFEPIGAKPRNSYPLSAVSLPS
jgi:hypothetical protein